MASWWQKPLAVAVGLAGVAGAAYYALLRRPIPKTNGTIQLQDLHEPVEVITDRYGVPHINAQNEDDLYYTQGYIHAQQRLWQMEMNRRIGSGRLSEIFGELSLEVDRFSRRLGLHRAAAAAVESLSEHNKRIFHSYASGVNAFLERNQHNLPIEFTLLRFKPEPWQISDSIQWSKTMGWNLGGNWETEVIRARLIAKLGPDGAALLEFGYDPGHPLILPPGIEYQGINLGMLDQYEQLKQLSGFGIMGGSNNWVVDGSMTVTGFPILCNDPHLAQGAPSIWFECHLQAGEIDAAGVSFPGTPGIVIGHNKYIAWGVTNAVSDIEDLYIEKFNPQNPNQYEYLGKWEEAQVVREEIKVKGANTPVIEEVRITRHGPILTSMQTTIKSETGKDGQSDTVELPLALHWTGQECHDIFSAVQGTMLATNWDDFRNALRNWDVPPQNFVYADIYGNIGYIMAGAIPIRAKGQSLIPSPGWTGEYEWTGYIPFDELPQIYNPEQHYVVTANNRVVDDSYPYYITHEWSNGYRAQRIRDLLTRKGKLALSDMAAIQGDQYALPAVELVPHMLSITASTSLEKAAQDVLRTWNYMLSPDSAGAAIYSTFLLKLERIIFSAKLGDDEALMHNYFGLGSTLLALQNGYASRTRPYIMRLLNERNDSWFSNSVIPNGPKSWDEALSSTLSATIDELSGKLGSDISRWKYGSIHKLTYNHFLGIIKPLNKIFNRGPYPFGGDIDTVNVGATLVNQPEVVVTVPSYRQIVNLSDMKASLSGHSPGQSGHPASKHYADFIQRWMNVSHHPMLFDRSMIEENAEGILYLRPE